MFQECKELEKLNLSNFNTSKVADIGYMFNNYIKLKIIKGIEEFKINEVTNMSQCFKNLKS